LADVDLTPKELEGLRIVGKAVFDDLLNHQSLVTRVGGGTYLDSTQIASLHIYCFSYFSKRPCTKTVSSAMLRIKGACQLTRRGTGISHILPLRFPLCRHFCRTGSLYSPPSGRCSGHHGCRAWRDVQGRLRHRAAVISDLSVSPH
jgi:hypothetical protein